jgi:succinate dehydrogenase / fumarate reductase, cytochrome b subunit
MTALAPPQASSGLLASTVAKKVVMALTGVILSGFVLVHMAGNLLLYKGPEALNNYAATLQSSQALVWSVRALLLGSVVLHIWAAASLTATNLAARPVGYRKTHYEASTYASRTMRWGGPLLLLFIVYHLLHFTVGSLHPDFVRGDVYRNVVIGFSHPLVAFFYVIAMIALSLHLFHGVDSMLQTLGLSHPRYNATRTMIGAAFAAIVTVGNLSFPLSVYFGLVR